MNTLKFSIKNFIRKWVGKLFPRNSIEKEMKVQIAVSGSMDNAIQLWKDMYENHPPWTGEDGTLCTNIPATIAEEMARLVLTEFELSVTGSPMADFINDQLKRELSDLDIQVERYCAEGGIVLKPYVSVGMDGQPNKIEIDFVEADKFYPTAFTSKGEIMSAIFLQHKRMGEYLYTRLEYHEFSGNSVTIVNKAYRSEKIASYTDDEEPTINQPFDEEVSLSEVDEWAGLSEEPVTINNIEKPLFVYIKVAKSNNIDRSSPLGVSIYSKAIELIHEADRRRRTESIRRAEDNPAANVLEAQGELADGGRFARAVHADDEHDHRPAQRRTRNVHLLNHDIFEHLLGGIGILDLVFAHAAAQFIHHGGCRLHAAVGHEQDVFEFLIEVLVNLPRFLHQRIDAPHQRITRLGQSFTQFCEQSHRYSFFLRGIAP